MTDFEPIDDLNDEEWSFWVEVTCDILCLEDIERRATRRQRYLVLRNNWRYGYWRKRRK